ncbi:MAG: lipopolysaccharide biosynthesis protein [Solirubrobacterales bacterium]|nr:lipopolysaccharide biosynthesis protein [Solirubrobacterales bacterium]
MGPARRLLYGTAAYQAAALVANALALVTLPLYTKHLTTADYGYAETLLTAIIFTSIVLRLGIGEALVRFWFDDEDPERRRQLAHTATAWTFWITTPLAVLGAAFSAPLSRALLSVDDPELFAGGVLGLWAFTNLEVAYALLRVEERRATYLRASLINVLLTVTLTILLVVVLEEGAAGYVLGNYAASAAVLLGLWLTNRDQVSLRPPQRMRALLAFGAPTVPADATVFALNVVDRWYLLRVDGPDAAGRYAFAAKLSAVVIVAVRGFQAAWPPLAYSITDEDEAGRLYARVTTAYVVVTGLVVAGVTLLGRWVVDLLSSDPTYEGAFEALPWVALGWALYGLVLVLVTVAGRAKVTTRNFPATAAGLAVNVVLIVLLVPPLGIAGAGIALCGAYAVILVVLQRLTRGLFHVPFERARLLAAVGVLAAVAVGGELLLPTEGAAGLVSRAALLAATPALLVAAGAIRVHEVRTVVQARRSGE